MNEIIDLIKSANWQTILAMFTIGWYFSRDIKLELKEFRQELKDQRHRSDELTQRIDGLYQNLIDIIKKSS